MTLVSNLGTKVQCSWKTGKITDVQCTSKSVKTRYKYKTVKNCLKMTKINPNVQIFAKNFPRMNDLRPNLLLFFSKTRS